MKLTRRKFFAGLAVAPLAIAIAPALRWIPKAELPLLQLAQSIDPSSRVAHLIAILNEPNEILTEMTSIQTGLPPKEWRRLYSNFRKRHEI